MDNINLDSFNNLKQIFSNMEEELIWEVYAEFDFKYEITINKLLEINNIITESESVPNNSPKISPVITTNKKPKKTFSFNDLKKKLMSKRNEKKYQLIDNKEEEEEMTLLSNDYNELN